MSGQIMATDGPIRGRERPSERHMAFAVSIVNLKPEELTIREYIQLLRRHVANGRRERHLDTSSYWRLESKRMEAAWKECKDQALDLAIEVSALKSKIDSARPTIQAKKRKRPDESVVPVPRSPKKSKVERSPAKHPSASCDAVSEFDFPDLGEVGNILIRSFYQIHAILKSHYRTESTELAHHCVRAAASLSQVVQKATQHPNSTDNSDIDFLSSVLTAAGRATRSLITGINRLSHVVDGVEVQSHVTYAYVQMYRKLLEAFAQVSLTEVSKSVSGQSSGSLGKNKQSPSKANPKQQRPLNASDAPRLNLLAKFLCSLIDNLDPKVEAHKSLFEGCAYFILDRVGSRLYMAAFGHCRGETMEKEIAASQHIDEIEDTSEPLSANHEEMQIKCAKLEAPYLVHLLKRIMSAAPVYLGTNVANKSARGKQASKRGSTKGPLAITAKERLQRTLVNCMFGIEDVDEGDPFMDCLKLPAINRSNLPMPKVKEVDVQDWFKEEIWRLLGWNILEREQDW